MEKKHISMQKKQQQKNKTKKQNKTKKTKYYASKLVNFR